jgi:hypothetical protein
MARIETDPNYSSPTFSRATAATDLFKKEDVQNLAAAVSTHDHSSTKGLILSPSAIPDGSISTAKLADGAVTTAKMVDRAASAPGGTTASTSSPTTTSTTYVGIPEMSRVLSLPNPATLYMAFQGVFLISAIGTDFSVSIFIDGVANNSSVATWRCTAANFYMPIHTFCLQALSPGAHTIDARWSVSTGTATAFFIYHHILTWEIYK